MTPTLRTPIASSGMPALVVPPARRRPVRLVDRLWDVGAAILLIAGVSAFFYARAAIGGIAAETAAPPTEETWVARTERYDRLSRLGFWLVGAGAAVGAVASIRHARGEPLWEGSGEA